MRIKYDETRQEPGPQDYCPPKKKKKKHNNVVSNSEFSTVVRNGDVSEEEAGNDWTRRFVFGLEAAAADANPT